MAFFDSFTGSLKEKWLQFFQVNHDWLSLHMQVESVYTPDGGRRPPSYLILGVLNALEPKLSQLMLPFSKLNPDADTLIEVLDLNFDPDIALGNRFSPSMEEQHSDDSPALPPETSGATSSLEASDDDETVIELGPPANVDDIADDFSDMSLDTMDEPTQLQDLGQADAFDESFDNSLISSNESNESIEELSASDAFGEISFDTEDTADEPMLEDLSTPEDNAFEDVLSDVWGNESMLDNTTDDNLLGEELPFDDSDNDSEISNLFPNT
ncbi:MAG: DUF5331 domain-containing protein [Nostocaceae cyanobacterium]|nr:DUF5331 domain-containing protein [Nostocaceae cyanobacterium]